MQFQKINKVADDWSTINMIRESTLELNLECHRR